MRSCPNCSNLKGLRYLWNTGIVKCPRCDLAYTDRLPSLAEIEAIYRDEAYFHGGSYTDYLGDKEAAQKNLSDRLHTVLQLSPKREALFEAGCAYGLFLDLARQHWRRVEGIDMSEDATAHAREVLGLDVAAGDFESHPPQAGAFDVVAMWDVIEHLYDPVLAVRKSAEALRPGGLLALTTGDISALVPTIRKQKWRLILPQHLYYFSPRSLIWLLDAHGFDVVHVSHPSYYRSLRQISEVITWRRPDSRGRQAFKSAVNRLPFMHWKVPLNLRDIIFVIGRKRITD